LLVLRTSDLFTRELFCKHHVLTYLSRATQCVRWMEST